MKKINESFKRMEMKCNKILVPVIELD